MRFWGSLWPRSRVIRVAGDGIKPARYRAALGLVEPALNFALGGAQAVTPTCVLMIAQQPAYLNPLAERPFCDLAGQSVICS